MLDGLEPRVEGAAPSDFTVGFPLCWRKRGNLGSSTVTSVALIGRKILGFMKVFGKAVAPVG